MRREDMPLEEQYLDFDEDEIQDDIHRIDYTHIMSSNINNTIKDIKAKHFSSASGWLEYNFKYTLIILYTTQKYL